MIRRLSDRFWNYLTDRIEARMHLRPDRDNTLDLGSSDYQWRRVYVGPGSAAAPAITLDGDTDTGIYQSAANNLDFATGGAQRLNISSQGVESAGFLRATGQGTGAAGPGIEIEWDGTRADFLAYDRTGAAYLPMRFRASDFTYYVGTTLAMSLSSTGLTVAGSLLGTTAQAARVYNNANLTIPNATWTSLTFNSERFDYANMHSTTTNTSRLVAPVTGVYLITATAQWQNNQTGRRIMRILVNGTDTIARQEWVPTTDPAQTITTVYSLLANHYAEVQVYQTSGSEQTIYSYGAWSPDFAMARIA